MSITEALMTAQSEYPIYFLLTAYVESALHGTALPARMLALPVRDAADVRARLDLLLAQLGRCAWTGDAASRPIVQDAVRVFGAASRRLHALDCAEAPRCAA
jgi:hypothetical protein